MVGDPAATKESTPVPTSLLKLEEKIENHNTGCNDSNRSNYKRKNFPLQEKLVIEGYVNSEVL
jgi:hypothetical protein